MKSTVHGSRRHRGARGGGEPTSRRPLLGRRSHRPEFPLYRRPYLHRKAKANARRGLVSGRRRHASRFGRRGPDRVTDDSPPVPLAIRPSRRSRSSAMGSLAKAVCDQRRASVGLYLRRRSLFGYDGPRRTKKSFVRLIVSPTLRQTWPRELPEAAMCVQDVDVQCVLQFTLIHAAGCALHRPPSRVIHHLELSKKMPNSVGLGTQRAPDATTRKNQCSPLCN